MCLEDLLIGMYAIGGTGMILIAWKLFGKHKIAKQKADAGPSTDHQSHPVSTK